MGHLPIISLSQSSFEDADPDFVNRVWEGKLQPFTPNAEVTDNFSYDADDMLDCILHEICTGKQTQLDPQAD